MNPFDLFKKYRNTEPLSILLLRAFVMIALMAALVGYITALFIDIANEPPSIKTLIYEADSLPIPDLVFAFKLNFKMQCKFYTTQGAVADSCDNYLYQPTLSNGSYIGAFTANSERSFTQKGPNPIGFVGITAFVNDPSFNYKDDNVMTMMAIDSEKDPINVQYAGQVTQDMIDSLPVYTREFMFSNVATMVNGEVVSTTFTRGIRNSIKKRFIDIFGITPEMEQVPFIMISTQGIPNPVINVTQTYVSGLLLKPLNFIIREDTEQRIKTQNKLRSTLPLIPLVNQDSTNISQNINDQSALVSHLQDRINALEMFLKEYVVDTEYLESLVKKGTKSHGEKPVPNNNRYNEPSYNVMQTQQPYYSPVGQTGGGYNVRYE
ncbi:7568_t:CDS:2 [Acaulospora morrowiae]|uniref:7568_t:CDS:1 n=1 Tax=Acaulospora morrowiae TaxID=94023 RepID=A0A9N8V8N3_9GLOM|nr:7568_t:CDS:2 [Acaulospora morrowiae]